MIANLNLHSTMLLLNPSTDVISVIIIPIYIPLCFYLIGLPERIWKIMALNLHSTMLLLNHRLPSGGAPPYLIYIPLCFYLIGILADKGIPVDLFTFHYAST